jgi:hypothetical protein
MSAWHIIFAVRPPLPTASSDERYVCRKVCVPRCPRFCAGRGPRKFGASARVRIREPSEPDRACEDPLFSLSKVGPLPPGLQPVQQFCCEMEGSCGPSVFNTLRVIPFSFSRTVRLREDNAGCSRMILTARASQPSRFGLEPFVLSVPGFWNSHRPEHSTWLDRDEKNSLQCAGFLATEAHCGGRAKSTLRSAPAQWDRHAFRRRSLHGALDTGRWRCTSLAHAVASSRGEICVSSGAIKRVQDLCNALSTFQS